MVKFNLAARLCLGEGGAGHSGQGSNGMVDFASGDPHNLVAYFIPH